MKKLILGLLVLSSFQMRAAVVDEEGKVELLNSWNSSESYGLVEGSRHCQRSLVIVYANNTYTRTHHLSIQTLEKSYDPSSYDYLATIPGNNFMENLEDERPLHSVETIYGMSSERHITNTFTINDFSKRVIDLNVSSSNGDDYDLKLVKRGVKIELEVKDNTGRFSRSNIKKRHCLYEQR